MHSDRYDKLAFRYVSYVAIPLLAAYTIYSLIYESHKGWYSFVISTLTSFVYMFGFVSAHISRLANALIVFLGAISPSINYKLQTQGNRQIIITFELSNFNWIQSVAHMPMKAMIYKTLSTVVDDFFA